MKILITGGSGFTGSKLIPLLIKKGHEIINLSRSSQQSDHAQLQHMKWDARSIPEGVGEIDVVINLAGANVSGKRWSDAYKKLILDSRIEATTACADFIRQAKNKPKVFISASGYNYYGDDFKETYDESGPAGPGFLAGVCQKWEAAGEGTGVRTVFLRTSVVIGKEDSALQKMVTPYKMFVGGPIGSGKQGFPWMHILDWVRAVDFIIDTEAVEGPVNMVAPKAIRQEEFSAALASALGRPNFFRVPGFALKLVVGEFGEMLLGGGFVTPGVLEKHGFTWQFPTVKEALKDLLN